MILILISDYHVIMKVSDRIRNLGIILETNSDSRYYQLSNFWNLLKRGFEVNTSQINKNNKILWLDDITLYLTGIKYPCIGDFGDNLLKSNNITKLPLADIICIRKNGSRGIYFVDNKNQKYKFYVQETVQDKLHIYFSNLIDYIKHERYVTQKSKIKLPISLLNLDYI